MNRRITRYRSACLVLLFASATCVTACDIRGTLITDPDGGSRPDGDGATEEAGLSCGPTDTDGDGIPTELEGTLDRDGDGLGNDMDTDSDGDGIGDAIEVGPDPCNPVDTDSDGLYDLVDFDSDDDGLRDEHELAFGTSPTDDDSDDDGHLDGVEYALRTLGDDADSLLANATPFLLRGPNIITAPIRVAPERVEIVFLVEATNQARESVLRFGTSLSRRLPDFADLAEDVNVAAIAYSDFPVTPFGALEDRPAIRLLESTPISADRLGAPGPLDACPMLTYPDSDQNGLLTEGPNGVSDIVDAIAALPCFDGGDPEGSQFFALQAIASSVFLNWLQPNGTEMGEYRITAHSGGCTFPPELAIERRPTGIACLHDDAFRVVALIGHSAFHGDGVPDYPHSFFGLTGLFAAQRIRVVGVTIGPEAGLTDYREFATMTGGVDRDGAPLVAHAGPDADPTPLVLEQVRRLLDDALVDISDPHIVASSLDVDGANDGLELITEGSLEAGPIGALRRGTTVHRSLEIAFTEGVRPASTPTAYTFDIIALQSASQAIVARSQVAIVVAAQQDRP